jgi:hypothetical protein
MTGQLGNQMFQYALGRRLQLAGRNVRYYTGYYRQHPHHYFGLSRFPVLIPAASDNQVLAMRDDRHRLIDRIRRKIFGRHPHVVSEIDHRSYAFMEDVFLTKHAFIDGYWQSEKYFKDIQDVIRKDFTFPVSGDIRNQELAKEMGDCTSVSVHVRRGDYLGGFPVMDHSYYGPAMSYFREKYGPVRFYVFSNDMDWCRTNIQGRDVRYVDWNVGEDSLFDMWLMTQCKHNIIANSSFSWWGAWLNRHENKEVIAPKVWLYHADTPDICCDQWIRM